MTLPRRLIRWSLAGLATVFALVMLAATVGSLWLFSSLPQTQGRMTITGLHAPVIIDWDGDGIPHIQAATDHDAYLALGFVHAQDRLWQMETTRRIGAGRLAEIIGPSLMGTDKVMHSLGIYRHAETLFAAAHTDLRAALEGLMLAASTPISRSTKGALPPEYYLLRFKPEPWHPAVSLVWGPVRYVTN